MGPRRRIATPTALAVAMLFCGTVAGVRAQVKLPNLAVQADSDGSTSESELAQRVFVPAERRVLQQLASARQLLQEARYGEAVRFLGVILEGPEDYFFQPDKNVPTHRSLKAEAQRMIGRMPSEGRQLYELQYGARARQRLAEAISDGDADGLAEVARRFFHTQAGYEAALLLGLDHLDHARPLAGALSLQRLREATAADERFEPTLSFALATCWIQAGMPLKARETLSLLKARLGGDAIEVAGEPIRWFDDDGEAVQWLAELIGPHTAGRLVEAGSWVMFRGNPSRNATTAASAPLLNVRWRVPTTDDPVLEAKLVRDRQVYVDRGIPILPGLHALAVQKEFVIERSNKPPWRVESVILMRTFQNLLAVDFTTGKRLWEVPVDDPYEELLGNSALKNGVYNSSSIAAGLGFRVWDDATYGTMSSDGRYVFTIQDLSVEISTSSSQRTVIVNGRPVSSPARKPFNRLAAHDIRTGKLEWSLGGPSKPSGPWPALPQADTFFLGPPLPLMGRLYALGEVKGEIRLFALDARSGDLIWSQQLALVERDVLQDPFRRLAGVSPSYADGILLCPTSAGAVVAVDLATRSLLWGYRYGTEANSRGSSQLVALRMGRYSGTQPQGRWFDSTAIVADSRVLVTPAESDALHCLNLLDGELLWKQDRKDDLFVACVHGDNVVLVGRRQLKAVSLSETVESTEKIQKMERTGSVRRTVTVEKTVTRPKPAWGGRAVELPEGSMPSGRGFATGDRYFLPLSSAEVLAVDLAAGKTVQVSKSRKGNVPGNLVCYKGKVISQGVDGLEVFAQLGAVRQEVDRRLAAEPDDPVALALQGEVLLDEGKHSEAIASFRRSYGLDPDPRTRGLLRDALLSGLRLQFSAHRDCEKEIEQLIDEPGQRATYLRLMAAGLQDAGEWRAALDRYMELVDLDLDHRGMEPVSSVLSVRLDRWIRAQFAVLRREAKGEEETIDRAIEDRLQAALAADSTDSLRQFLDLFGDYPIAEKARRELTGRLKDSGRWLEAELVLWQRQRAADRSVAGAAVAELAELLRQAKRPEDAARCYQRLEKEFADVACLDGKTGRELLDALPEDGPVRKILGQDGRWPRGNVTDKEAPISARTTSYPRLAVPYRGGLGPFFSETTVLFDQSQRAIAGRDALGKERWRVSLVQPGASSSFRYNYNLTHARVRGHLLLLSFGNRIVAVDTLTPQPKVLWSQDLTDSALDYSTNVQQIAFRMGALQAFGGGFIMPPTFYPGYPNVNTGGLGPVTAGYACFQRYRDLIATDPLTGKVLWVRRGTEPGSTLFGDDQFLFAVAAGQTEATVFRALDGKLLGKRKVPPFVTMTHTPFSAPTRTMPTFSGSTSSGAVCIATLGRRLLVWKVEGSEAALELFDPWEQRQVWTAGKFTAGATTDMVGQEAIGLLEPGGRFVLVGLPDGRTITDVKLDREKGVSSISVLRCGEQYVLATCSSAPQAEKSRRIQQLPSNRYKPIGSGRVYSFDLEGKSMWAEPAEIKDQHLLLDQPGRLPVITFACGVFDQTKPSQLRHQMVVKCLDKRTGRVVYDNGVPYATSVFGLSGDPKTNSVELLVSRQRVVLTFTEEPIPPPSEAENKAGKLPSELPGVARGLFRAVGKAIGDAASNPPKPPGPGGPVDPQPAPNQPR